MRPRGFRAYALRHSTEVEFESVDNVSCTSVSVSRSVLIAVNGEFETMKGVVDSGAGLMMLERSCCISGNKD